MNGMATTTLLRRGGLVEERCDGGGEDRRAEQRVVRLARDDRQARLRAARAVPAGVALAAAEQAEELDRLRGREDVGVAGDDQRGRLDARDLLRVVVVLLHEVADLPEQLREVLGTRRQAGVE